MKRGHQTANTQTDGRTSQLLDQLGPEGRVGENPIHPQKRQRNYHVRMRLKHYIKNIL